jgi:L-fucose isomerase-like protein
VEIRRSKWSDLVKASLVYVSLRRLMEANQYDGIALQNCMSCYHAAGTNPCIAAMRLLDEGLPAACEGDMGALRIQLMTHWLFGRPSFIGEGQPTLWNTRISAHCTSPSKLRGYDRPHVPFLLMDHSESGRGVAPQVKWEVGHRVTFFNPLDGGWRGAKLGTGHVVSNSEQPPNGGCRTTVEFTLDGVASVSGCHVHHNMLVYGNVEREVDAFYTLLYGTTPEKFRDLDASKPASRAERASQVPSCLCCRQAHGPRA